MGTVSGIAGVLDVAVVSGGGGGGGGAITAASGAIAAGALAAGSLADGANVAQGYTTDAAYASGSGTVVSILKGVFAKLSGTLNVSGSVPFQLSITQATTNAGSYGATDCIGAVVGLTPVTRSNGGGGTLLNLRIRSAAGKTPSVAVFAWSRSPAATITDLTAFAPNAADNAYAIAGFPQTGTLAVTANTGDSAAYLNLSGIDATFVNQDGTAAKAIYLALVATSAFTGGGTSDITINANGYADA
jgi:hypothetical protein